MQSDAELLIAEPAAGHGARGRLCVSRSPARQRTLQRRGSRKGAAEGAAETEQLTDITERASSGALQKELEGYFVCGIGFLFVCLFFNKISSQQLETFKANFHPAATSYNPAM